MTPSARSGNLIAGDGTKNGLSRSEQKTSAQPKTLLDRKSPIQVCELSVPPENPVVRARRQTANFFGKKAAAGAKAAFANKQGDRVMQKLQDAEKSNLITKEDAKAVVSEYLGVANADPENSKKPLIEEKPVADALKKVLSGAGKKSINVSSSTGGTSQSVETKFSGDAERGSAAAVKFDVKIDGVEPLSQVKSLGCRAAAMTMLVGWKRQQSLTIETALANAGAPYPAKYADNTGLQPTEVPKFMADFGLRDASVGAITAGALAEFSDLCSSH